MIQTATRRRRRPSSVQQRDAMIPSPETICEMTAEIRQTWTPRERARRAGIALILTMVEIPPQPRRKGLWGDYLP